MEYEAEVEMWEAATSRDDSDWTCYCGNETVSGNPMPEHTVSEHNAVGYAADQCPDHGFNHDPERTPAYGHPYNEDK